MLKIFKVKNRIQNILASKPYSKFDHIGSQPFVHEIKPPPTQLFHSKTDMAAALCRDLCEDTEQQSTCSLRELAQWTFIGYHFRNLNLYSTLKRKINLNCCLLYCLLIWCFYGLQWTERNLNLFAGTTLGHLSCETSGDVARASKYTEHCIRNRRRTNTTSSRSAGLSIDKNAKLHALSDT